MGVKANAQDATAAWSSGMAGSGEKYKKGVMAVTVAPGQVAASRGEAYLAGVQASYNIWKRKVGNVTLQDWQQSAANKGAARLGSGAQAAAPKFQSFMSGFLPTLSSVVDSLPAGGTFDQNMARFQAYANMLHSKKGSF